MDVSFSQEQEQLRESARAFLAVECPMARVREAMADPRGACDELWRGLARLGWTGLVVPEARGGAGLGLVELSILLEEMGRVLLPVSFLATVAVVGRAVALLGSEARQAAILPPLAHGFCCR